MKNLKNPKESTLASTGLLVLGIVVGAMGSRALMGAVPNKTALTADEQKKQDLINYGVRAAIAGAGFAGASYANENKANRFVEGLGYGAAGIQVIDTTQELAKKSTAVQAQVNSGTKTGKVVGKMFGLACPCDNMTVMQPTMLNGHRKTRHKSHGRHLRGPGYNPEFTMDAPSKLQLAIDKGAMMAA